MCITVKYRENHCGKNERTCMEYINLLYFCFTENRRRDGLSHCLPKADRVSNPIDFYREPENIWVCPLFFQMTTFVEQRHTNQKLFQYKIIECNNLFSNQPLIVTTIFRIRQKLQFPRQETRVSKAGHYSFYVRILSFPRRDTTNSPQSNPNYPIALHQGIKAFSLII